MASTIGIKIANGEFYSILEEKTVVKKRLVLTTVHDNQESVHIDLYKSNTATMQNAAYVGSLLVEHIRARLKGEPSIELVIASNEQGEIAADATDLDSVSGTQTALARMSETRRLRISLDAPDDSPSQGVDFEVEDEMPVMDTPIGLYDSPAKKKFPLLLVVIIGVVLVITLFLLWFLLLRERNDGSDKNTPLSAVESPLPAVEPEPALVPVEPEPVVAAVVPPEPEPEPVVEPEAEPEPLVPIEEVMVEPEQAALTPAETPLIEAPVEAPEPPPEPPARIRRIPPVASYKVPTTIPSSGAPYRIRWGDTLWDISEAFYRNPWLYTRIARFNNIRNPDRIISGTTIRVPPRR